MFYFELYKKNPKNICYPDLLNKKKKKKKKKKSTKKKKKKKKKKGNSQKYMLNYANLVWQTRISEFIFLSVAKLRNFGKQNRW